MSEAFSTKPTRPRVTVIGGFMAYFEAIMEPGFRDDRRAHIDAIVAPLEADFDLTRLGLLADPEDRDRMARKIGQSPADAVLLIPTMTTPPQAIADLAAMCDAPVVIASAHALSTIGEDFDMAALCRHSSGVGATMIGAMLRRLDPPLRPLLVDGFLDDPGFHHDVALALRTAALAKRFDGLRLGRLGAPMPGYDHVGLSVEQAAISGFALVDIPLKDWTARISSITAAEINRFQDETLSGLVPPQTQIEKSDGLDRACCMAIALDRLADDHGLDCGSLTCRGPFGVELENGAIGCLATSLMTGTGRPFSATGDLVTAVAMLIGRTLGGATLYCELDAQDREREAFLVANTGEGDFAWSPPDGKAEIRTAAAHSGRDVPGVVLRHDLAPGPATMLGASLDRTRSERLTLIAMEGETLEQARTSLNVTNAWFRTAMRPAEKAFVNWANAGATHHGALSRGALAQATQWLGELCALPVTAIPGGTHDL